MFLDIVHGLLILAVEIYHLHLSRHGVAQQVAVVVVGGLLVDEILNLAHVRDYELLLISDLKKWPASGPLLGLLGRFHFGDLACTAGLALWNAKHLLVRDQHLWR